MGGHAPQGAIGDAFIYRRDMRHSPGVCQCFEPGDLVSISDEATHMANMPMEEALKQGVLHGVSWLYRLTGLWDRIVEPNEMTQTGVVLGYLQEDAHINKPKAACPSRFYFIMTGNRIVSVPLPGGIKLLQRFSDTEVVPV